MNPPLVVTPTCVDNCVKDQDRSITDNIIISYDPNRLSWVKIFLNEPRSVKVRKLGLDQTEAILLYNKTLKQFCPYF